MKNKRNTRRGRAKRWQCYGPGMWRLRRTDMRVWRWTFGGFDVCDISIDAPCVIDNLPRAAAMRAAEHLARGR